MVRSVSSVQLKKQWFPREVTVSGRTTFVMFSSRKASEPMWVTPSAKVMDFRLSLLSYQGVFWYQEFEPGYAA